MKKTTYTVIVPLVVVALIAAGIYSRVKSSKTDGNHKTEKETEYTPSSNNTTIGAHNQLPSDSFIATPHEIAELIDKDQNQIAEFFHDKGNVTRDDVYSSIDYYSSTYEPFGASTEKLYVRPKDSLVMRYTFRDKNQFMMFFEEVVKKASETMTYSNDDGVYPAFKIGNCLFVKNGFSMSGDKYIGTMYSLNKLKANRSKAVKQSKTPEDSSFNKQRSKLGSIKFLFRLNIKTEYKFTCFGLSV